MQNCLGTIPADVCTSPAARLSLLAINMSQWHQTLSMKRDVGRWEVKLRNC